ncbi:helix-turn-helix transcriptional regulator [Actinoplanes sp. HUAS TT8]|uniref:helix-turn-helix transcriptional regulator n=1 Tax=Actinoplanes sp. HUAS TT8 TaxID=3447453 RepID=UPI003F51C9CB
MRDAVPARLDGLVATGGVLRITGEPGPGRSAVLGYAVERADGHRILRMVAVPAEQDLPYAGLHLLLRMTGGDASAVLDRLDELGGGGPLLVAVDDADRLDSASLRALAGAARGLGRRRVVMLFADRGETAELDGLPELRLVPGAGSSVPNKSGLTVREAQVTSLARDGLSNAEIAERLALGRRTVESHLQRAFAKLGVHSRAKLRL